MSSNRSTWKSQAGYVWALIGSAVGFANILSFSAQVYKNGGGAFLFPYFIAMLLLGIPMLILEGLVGKKWHLPVVGAFHKKWKETGKVFGWLSALACLSIGAFYIVLTGYSAAYTYFAAADLIPEDSQSFFLNQFLQVTSGLTEFGSLSISILWSTLAVSFVAWLILVREVKDGIERICSWFMPLLAVIIFGFAIAVSLLPGGLNGWNYYLNPDFSRLGDINLWRDIFGQLFFSLSLGLGIIIGYSRHTANDMNIVRSMLWVALGDFLVSFIAGFAIFGCLAHISHVQNVPFDSILTTDSTFEIGFILFPQIFRTFGTLSTAIGTLFFFCVFVAGITGVFSIVESVAGNVQVEFKINRYKAVSGVMIAMVVLASPFCMGNASYIIDALVPMLLGTNMLIGGLALVFAFVFTRSKGEKNQLWEGGQEETWYYFSLRYLVPGILLVILALNLWEEMHVFDLAKAIRWSWFGLALTTAIILTVYTKKKPKTVTVE